MLVRLQGNPKSGLDNFLDWIKPLENCISKIRKGMGNTLAAFLFIGSFADGL
jgi:hypothetical protein